MKHLEDILHEAAIEEPLLHGGRWYVTKDAALAGMTKGRAEAFEEAAQIADDGTCIAECKCCWIEKGIARVIRQLK